MRLQRFLVSFFLAVALTPVPSIAQTSTGVISGTVVGEQGPLTNVTVTIRGAASRTVKARADGTFTISALPDGAYQVSIARSGYQTVRSTGVTIVAGNQQVLAVTLVAESLTSLRTIGNVTTTSGRSSPALNTSASSQVTITSQQFTDRGQTQVVNMLEEQPGVEITRVDSGSLGSNANIALRGANPYETQVLIDGHPVNGGSQGKYLIQFLNPLILGDVEIDKGPGAFGNTVQNAVGGSVNFRTPTITTRPTGAFLTGYDTFYGSTLGARYSDTIGKVGFLVAYAETGTPGYYANQRLFSVTSQGNNVPAPGGTLPATINTAILTSQTYNNRSELLKLAYNFSPSTTLTAGYYGSQSIVDYTGTLTTAEPFTIVAACPTCGSGSGTFTNPVFAGFVGQTVLGANTEDGLFQGNSETDNEPIFSLDLRTSIGRGTLLARYYAGAIDRLITDPQEPTQITGCTNAACFPPTVDGLNFNENETDKLHGGDFEYNVPIGVSSLTLSYDAHGDRSTFCENNATTPFPLTCTSNGLLISSNTFSVRGYIPLSSKLMLGFANYFSSTTFVGNRYDPKLSLVYRPGRNQSLRLSAGTAYVAPFSGFVAPIAGSTGSLTGAVLINGKLDVIDNLKPETSFSVDLGGDFATGRDSKFTVDLYNTILNNRFSTDTVTFTGGVTGTFNGLPITSISELFNLSDSHEQGIELGFIKAPRVGFGGTVGFELNRSYDFNTTQNPLLANVSVAAAQTGSFNGLNLTKDGIQIPGYAYTKGRGELNYQFANTARVAVGMTYYGDNNSFGQTAFELFDANLGVPLKNKFRLQLSGINLFNHDDGRYLSEFRGGEYTPIAANPANPTNPVNLNFAPPRQVTLQLSHPL